MKTCGVFTIHKYVIEVECGEQIELIPLGDIHRDSPQFYDVEYYRVLGWLEKKIKDGKKVIVLGMGDYVDYMSTSERQAIRSDDLHESTISTMDRSSHQSVQLLYEELKFLKGHIIGLLGGNHYWTYADGSTSDNELAKLLEVRFLGVKSMIRLQFVQMFYGMVKRSGSVDISAHHGTTAPRTMAASMAAVVRMTEDSEADIFLQGHDHKRFIFPGQTKLVLDGTAPYLKDRTLWFGRTGSFIRGMIPGESSYITDRNLPPAQLGVIRIEMTPRREEEHLVIDIHGSV